MKMYYLFSFDIVDVEKDCGPLSPFVSLGNH